MANNSNNTQVITTVMTLTDTDYLRQLNSVRASTDRIGRQIEKNLTWDNKQALNSIKEVQDRMSVFSRTFKANFFADVGANFLAGALERLTEVTTQAVIYAARVEELGVVLDNLAKINDVSTQTIIEQEQAIKRLNITTEDSRQTLARFMNVGFDISKASPLARVAQDLAVIGNKNTSDELNALIIAIQTLQSRNLRSAGVFLTVDEVLDNLANTTGRARDSFSTLEKQQAMLNAVLQYGTRVAGTYEASMETVSKRMRSLDRHFKEAQNSIGEQFIPAMGVAVDSSAYLLQTIEKYPSVFTNMAYSVGLFSAALISLNTNAVTGLIGTLAGIENGAKNLLNNISGKTLFETTQVAAEKQRLADEATKSALIKQQNLDYSLQLDISIAQLRLANQSLMAESAKLEKAKKTTENLAQQAVLTSQIRANENSVARAEARSTELKNAPNGGVPQTVAPIASFGSKVASFLGYAGLVIGAVYSIYSIGDAIYQAVNAPRDVKNIDITAYEKNQDLIAKNQTLINSFSNDSVNQTLTSLEIKKKEYEAVKDMTASEQVRYGLTIKQGQVVGDVVEALKKQNQFVTDKNNSVELTGMKSVFDAFSNVEKIGKKLEVSSEASNKFRETRQAAEAKFGDEFKLFNVLENASAQARGVAYISSENPTLKGFSNDEKERMTYWAQLAGGVSSLDITAADTKELQTSEAVLMDSMGSMLKIANKTGRDLNQMLKDAMGETLYNESNIKGIGENLVQAEREKFINTNKESMDSTTIAGTVYKSWKLARDNKLQEIRVGQLNEVYRRASMGVEQMTVEEMTRQQLEARRQVDESFFSGQSGREYQGLIGSSITKELQTLGLGENSTKEQISSLIPKAIENLKSNGKVPQELFDLMKNKKQNDRLFKEVMKNIGVDEGLQKLEEAKSARDNFFSGDKKELTQKFDTIALNDETQKLEKLAKLQYEVYGKINIPESLKGDKDAQDKAIVKIEKEQSIKKQILVSEERLAELKKGDLKNPRLAQLEREIKVEEGILTANERIKELKKGVDPRLEKAERALKIEEAVYKTRNAYKEVEDEIAILKQNLTIPAVSLELTAQKEVLEQVLKRRDAERQLTVDIAVEIDKRSRYAATSIQNSNRLVAQTFLGEQQDRYSKLEEAQKSFYASAFEEGNSKLFEDNPLIQEAVKQSTQLEELNKNGGIQGQKMDITNESLKMSIEVEKAQVNETINVRNAVKDSTSSNQTSFSNLNATLEGLKIAFQTGAIGGTQFGGAMSALGLIGGSVGVIGGASLPFASKGSSVRYTSPELATKSYQYGYNQEIRGLNKSQMLVAAQVEQELLARGLPLGAVQWLMANAFRESHFNTKAVNANDYGSASVGIWQHKGKRISKDNSIKGQVDNLVSEITGNRSYRALSIHGLSDEEYRNAAERLEAFRGIGRARNDAPNGMDWGGLNQGKNAGARDWLYGKGNRLANVRVNGIQPVNQDNVVKTIKSNQTAKVVKPVVKSFEEKTEDLKKLLAKVGLSYDDFGNFENVLGNSVKFQNGKYGFPKDNEASDLSGQILNFKNYRKYYKDTPNDRKTVEDRLITVGEFVKEDDEYRKNKRITRAKDEVIDNNLLKFRSKRLDELNTAYEEEVKEERRYGRLGRMARRQIAGDKMRSLQEGGALFNKTLDEKATQQAEAQVDRTTKLIELRQKYYKQEAYYKDLTSRLNDDYLASVLEQDQKIEEEEANLALRRKNRGVQQALAIRNEVLEREKARESVQDDIDAQTRYNTFYLGSQAQVLDLTKKADLERLKSHSDTITKMMELEINTANAREGLMERLALKFKEIENAKSKEYENNLIKQIEVEDEYKRKSDGYNKDDFRNKALDKLNGSRKSITDLKVETFSDTFDAFSGGFQEFFSKLSDKTIRTFDETTGKWEEKTVKRFGIFTNLINNFAQKIFDNFLATQFKGILDKIAPKNENLLSAEGLNPFNKTGEAAQTQAVAESVAIINQFNMALSQSIGLLNGRNGSNLPEAVGNLSGALNFVGSAGLNVGSVMLTGAGVAMSSFSQLVRSGKNPFAGSINNISNTVNNGVQKIGGLQNNLNTGSTSGLSDSYVGGAVAGGSDIALAGSHSSAVSQSSAATMADVGHSTASKAAQAGKPTFWGGLKNQVAGALPGLGGGLGNMLGGGSGVGGTLGTIGGTIAGTLGMGLITGSIVATSAQTTATGAATGLLGLSGAATLGIGAAIAGAFLLASWLFGRSKRIKQEKASVSKASSDAMSQLNSILAQVKTDKIDGDQAISQADEIRKTFADSINNLKTKQAKSMAQQELGRMDSVIGQIKTAAQAQKNRRETDLAIAPTYAQGGFIDTQYARVSSGEVLTFPTGGQYRVPGVYDAKDSYIAKLPLGTMIQNPTQVSLNQIPAYANGGILNGGNSVAPVVSVQPNITAIIVMSEVEAQQLAAKIPNSVIVGKVNDGVRNQGNTGLVATIAKELSY